MFNPKVPNKPYKHNGYVIEDDFTERISLATNVKEAAEAMYNVLWQKGGSIQTRSDFVNSAPNMGRIRESRKRK